MKRKTHYPFVGILIMMVIVAGCSAPAPLTQEQQPLKIGIIAYPGFAPFYIAQEKGFFEQQGVQAQVITFSDVPAAISVLASNEVQMLFSSADFTTILADSGIAVKQVLAADIGYGSDGFVARNDVQTIKDLKGKKVHVDMGTPSHFLLAYIADQQGINLNEDVELVQMSADQVGSGFVAGHLDYGLTWEPWLSQAKERKDGRSLFTSKDYPGIITDTFVVRGDVLLTQRDDVKDVLRAWFDSLAYLESNREDAISIIAKNLGLPAQELDAMLPTVKLLTYEENLEKFSATQDLNLFSLTKTASRLYKSAGITSTEVSGKDVVDASLLAELYN